MKKYALLLLLNVGSGFAATSPSDWIASLGGGVERNAQGKIVAVNLRGTWVSDVELIDIAALPDLERLDLSHTRISDEGMLHLKGANGIRELNLRYAEQITDQGMNAIKAWSKLTRLELRGTRISNGTLEIVSHLTGLEALDVANTQVTDNGLDLLITLTNLKLLALGRGRNGETDLSFLRNLGSLTELDLNGARPIPPDMGGAAHRPPPPIPPIPQKTIEALAELHNLRTLRLGFSGVTAADLKALSSLQNVQKLGLQECPRVDDDAVAELVNWKSLKYVDLQSTKVTPDGIGRLRRAHAGIVILSGN
jgi:Leucine-rich repeat (LRR) protein